MHADTRTEDLASEDWSDDASDVERGQSTSLDSPTYSENVPSSASHRLASALCMGDMSSPADCVSEAGRYTQQQCRVALMIDPLVRLVSFAAFMTINLQSRAVN